MISRLFEAIGRSVLVPQPAVDVFKGDFQQDGSRSTLSRSNRAELPFHGQFPFSAQFRNSQSMFPQRAFDPPRFPAESAKMALAEGRSSATLTVPLGVGECWS